MASLSVEIGGGTNGEPARRLRRRTWQRDPHLVRQQRPARRTGGVARPRRRDPFPVRAARPPSGRDRPCREADHRADARAWLAKAAVAAAAERALLARLAVAAGPLPSTPGGGASETAIQRAAPRARHARPVRPQRLRPRRRARLRDRLGAGAPRRARRRGEPARRRRRPARLRRRAARCRTIADERPRRERALLFGAQQLAVQHHGALGPARGPGRRAAGRLAACAPAGPPLSGPCVSKAPDPMSRPTTSRSRSTPRSRCGGRCSSRASRAPARPCWRTRSPPRSARR